MTYLNDKISEVSLQAEAAGSATSARKINIKDIPRKNGLIEADANTLPVLLASPDWVFVNYVTPWCAQCVEMASGWKELARTVVRWVKG